MTNDHQLPPEVVILLAGVLAEPAFTLWSNTRIGRLGGRTPNEAIGEGDLEAVLELVRDYQDPSFT